MEPQRFIEWCCRSMSALRGKANRMLEQAGYDVYGRILSSRAEVDALKNELGVDTTPQVIIAGERVGGSDDLERYLISA